MSSLLCSSPVSVLMIVALNPPLGLLLVSVLHKSLAVVQGSTGPQFWWRQCQVSFHKQNRAHLVKTCCIQPGIKHCLKQAKTASADDWPEG